MRIATFAATTILAAGLFFSPAWAGVLIVSDHRSLVDPADKETSTVYLERDRLRVETKGPEGEQIVIFRKDRQLFWVVDKKEGTYFEMTKESLRKMKEGIEEQMKGVREMMAEQMKNLSPEERKMLEQMGARPMVMEPPKPVYRKVSSGVKVGHWKCDKYEGFQGREKIEEVWATDFKELGLSPEDFRPMEEMQKFSKSLSGGAETAKPRGWQEDQGYPGLPVREVSFLHGRMDEEMEVREISRQNFPPSLFELPKGLKKMEQPFGQGMRPDRHR